MLLALFHIDVTFEMRTVLYVIHLFNDDVHKHGRHFYMKRKEGKREQHSRERGRGRESARVRVAVRVGSVSCKNNC
jgi:hypothetical protein